MAESMTGAIGDLMRLQRWNAMPRVEIWTEAENIAYVTHTVYAIGKTQGLGPDLLLQGISRALLKSFIKHQISDIPAPTREVIRKQTKKAWKKVVDTAANQSSSLFPMEISGDIRSYMTHSGDYSIGSKKANSDSSSNDKEKIEELIRFAQEKAALQECKINMKVYDDFYETLEMDKAISERLKELKHYMCHSTLNDYLIRIENLKNLRRWNRINRSVETTVLGHTFVVAFLTLVVAKLYNKRLQGTKTTRINEYNAILRALFHDLPEAFTGDIITPVKQIIEKEEPNIIGKVEGEMTKQFRKTMPTKLKADMTRLNLLEELNDSEPYTVDSLVKACDRLAVVFECLLEMESGQVSGEMSEAYAAYVSRLENSEWAPVRELCTRVLFEHPKLSRK